VPTQQETVSGHWFEDELEVGVDHDGPTQTDELQERLGVGAERRHLDFYLCNTPQQTDLCMYQLGPARFADFTPYEFSVTIF